MCFYTHTPTLDVTIALSDRNLEISGVYYTLRPTLDVSFTLSDPNLEVNGVIYVLRPKVLNMSDTLSDLNCKQEASRSH